MAQRKSKGHVTTVSKMAIGKWNLEQLLLQPLSKTRTDKIFFRAGAP